MTKLMKQAIERLQSLPEESQDLFAGFILSELSEDDKWSRTTEANDEKLRGLIEALLEADRRGEFEILDPDTLSRGITGESNVRRNRHL